MVAAIDSPSSTTNVEEQYQRVRTQFEEWDLSGNGFIAREELRAMLVRLRPDFTEPELEAIMDAVDTDGTGSVDYQAFVDWAFSGQSPRSNGGSRNRVTISRTGNRRASNRRAMGTTCGVASSSWGGSVQPTRYVPGGGIVDDDGFSELSARERSRASSSRASRRQSVSKGGEAAPVVAPPLSGIGSGSCSRRNSESPHSSSSSLSPRYQATGDGTGRDSPMSPSRTLAEALRAQAQSPTPRRMLGQNALSRLPPLTLSSSLAPPEVSTAASSRLRTAPPRQRHSLVDSSRSLAGSVQFPLKHNGSKPGALKVGSQLLGPHDGPLRPVDTAELKQAMDQLRKRMESGQAVMSDRLLRRLTTSTVHSECATGGDPEAAVKAISNDVACIPEVEFGCDSVSGNQSTEIGTCGICFEEGVDVLSLCGLQSCTDRFCVSCSGRHAETLVTGALYAMPWLKCPGCASRVETQVWSGWVETSIFSKYLSNGEALLNFRCPSCHDTGSLFRKCIPERPKEFKLADIEGMQGISEATCKRFRKLWCSYSQAHCSAEEFVSDMVSLLHGLDAEDGSAAAEHSQVEGAPPERLQKLMRPSVLPALIADAERRCSMQLAFLRRFPKIRTPCCDAQMCFKCKVSGWHSGESCEFRQRKEVHKDLQFCPGCNVPTVKSEGCDHIVCVCGESWTWAPNPVWNLVRNSQMDMLRDLFADEFDVNFSDEETGETLLHVAAESGSIDVLSFLIEQGADVSRLDAAGSTILAAAVRRPYRENTLDVLRALLNHQADVNASISPDGGFVITEALRTLAYGRTMDEDDDEREEASDRQRGVDLVELLLSARASVGVRDEDLDGATPLLEAIRGGFDDIAAMLIAAQAAQPDLVVPPSMGIDVPSPSRALPGEDLQDDDLLNINFLDLVQPPPPPRRAADLNPEEGSSDTPVPPPLGPSCSSLEAADHSGNTPLYLAVSNRRHAVVAALLAARVSPDVRGPSSTPPLHTAISNQDRESFNLLIACRADANATAEDGHLALHAAMRALYRDANNIDAGSASDTWTICHRMVLRVIPMTTDVNAAAQDGQTALGAAAANGSIEIMEALLHHGALPDRGARGGTGPLSLAAQCGQVDAVRLLLRSLADPRRVDRGGQTALHRLASNWLWQDSDPRRSDDPWVSCRGRKTLGRAEVAGILVEKEADVNGLDIICRTPLLLACDPPTPVMASKEQQAVVDTLLSLRSNANLASSTGITPLIAAVQKDVEVVAQQLLKHGVDTNSPEPLSGSRPLKIAIQRMHVGIVRALVEHRAEVSTVDRSGQNAACAWVESFASAYKAKRGPWAPKQRLFEEMLQAITCGRTKQAFAPCRGVPPLLAAWKQLDGLGQRAAIQMLLQAKADANSVDGNGRTLLHSVCGQFGNQRSIVTMTELLQSLLHARANAVRESEAGDTPLDLVANAGPSAQQAFKALLGSLPERSLTAPRWSQLFFRELEGGNEALIMSLVPRTGTMHFNALGQGPLEFILGQSLLRNRAPWQTEAAIVEPHGAAALDLEAQLRFAELVQKHGGVLPTPAWVWSRAWPAARASHALRQLEDLQDQGPQHLAKLAGADDWPLPLAGLFVASCALVGLEPEIPLPMPAAASPAHSGSRLSDAAIRFRAPVQHLLAGEGAMLLSRLACASSIEAYGLHPLQPHVLSEMRCFLEDSASSGPDVLQRAGGTAAVLLGMWVRATFELAHVPKPVPVTLQAISNSVQENFADRLDLRQRWLKVLLTSLCDMNAQDGAGGSAAHLALRIRDLGVGDVFLPLLQRGANVGTVDASGTSVAGLLKERALEALEGLPPLGDDAAIEEACILNAATQRPSPGFGSDTVVMLANAIVEVERCTLQLRLQEAASKQCSVIERAEVDLREVVVQVEAMKLDIQAEFSQAVPSMDQALEAVDRLEYEELGRTSAIEEPGPALAMVFAAACEILGKGKQAARDKRLGSLPSTSWSHEACMGYWPAAQRLLSAGLIIQQVHCHDKDSTSDENIEILRTLQAQLDLSADDTLQASQTGATIALWMRALLAYHSVSSGVKPKKDQLQQLALRMEARERYLSEALKALQEIQAAEDASRTTSVVDAPVHQHLRGITIDLKGRSNTALAASGQALRDALRLFDH